MLVIRLARTGRKKHASYRLVAADSRRAARGKYIEQLGHYNPHTKEFKFEKPAVEEFIKKGAQPSATVVSLLLKEKVSLPDWAKANLKVRKRAPKKKAESSPTGGEKPVADVPANPAATPAEEPASAKAETEVVKAEQTAEPKADEKKPKGAKTEEPKDEPKAEAPSDETKAAEKLQDTKKESTGESPKA